MATGSPRILVPLDGSHNAENAVPAAAQLARLYGLPVRIIHVVDENEGVLSTADFDRARATFSAYATGVAARHGIPTDRTSTEVGWGSSAATILAAAGGARFIVIASHGRGGVKATFIGSVADKVIRGANVPVLFVPAVEPPATLGTGRILVALDGSPAAEKGLTAARELAAKVGATVTLLRAVSVPPAVGVEFAYYPPEVMPDLESAATDYLRGVAQEGETVLVTKAAAAAAIEQVANEIGAELVVMTSHGKGLAARLALGSTTDRVMHSLRRLLLIIPVDYEGTAASGGAAG